MTVVSVMEGTVSGSEHWINENGDTYFQEVEDLLWVWNWKHIFKK